MNGQTSSFVANHPITRALEACSARPMTLGSLLADVAGRHASRQAIAFRGEAISYRELWLRARAVAKALLAHGFAKGTRVAMLMSSRPEFIAAIYGTAMVGGVVIPLHSVATARDREYMLRHSDAALLLFQSAFLRQNWLEELLQLHPEAATQPAGSLRMGSLPCLRRVVCLDDTPGQRGIQPWRDFLAAGEGISDALLDAVAGEVHPSDDAVMIYTSGSTGNPKGVLHRQRAAALQQWRTPVIYGMAEDERVWSVNPFFWSAGFAFFLGTLTSGGCMVLQERFDPTETLELLERERVTMLASAVTTLGPLADHPDVKKRDLSAVRHLPTLAGLRRHLDVKEKQWGPTVAWGLTETMASCTYVLLDEDDPMTEPGGYAMPGIRIRVVHPDTRQPVAQGEFGELAVTGTQIMRGYYKKNTEECFDPDGFVLTGDGGYIDECGRVHYTTRLANMIKTKGANVSPLEVEAALARWGRTKLSFVVGIPEATRGEDIVACVIFRDDQTVTEDEVLDYLRKELASYKVPRHVLFMRMEDIPMTGSNKPKLGELRKIAAGLVAEKSRKAG